MFRNCGADDYITENLTMLSRYLAIAVTLACLCCLLCSSALSRLIFPSFSFHKWVRVCLYRPFSNRKLNANQQRNAAICFTMMSGGCFFSWKPMPHHPSPVWFTMRRWPLPSFYHHILGGGVVLLLTSFAWFVRPHIAKRPRVLKITICQQQKYNHYKYWYTWGKCAGVIILAAAWNRFLPTGF